MQGVNLRWTTSIPPTQGGVEIFLVTSDYIKTEFGSRPDEPLGSDDDFNFFPYTTQELC